MKTCRRGLNVKFNSFTLKNYVKKCGKFSGILNEMERIFFKLIKNEKGKKNSANQNSAANPFNPFFVKSLYMNTTKIVFRLILCLLFYTYLQRDICGILSERRKKVSLQQSNRQHFCAEH